MKKAVKIKPTQVKADKKSSKGKTDADKERRT